MPWKNSKTIPGLITHYGRWTKRDENDFYNSVSFSDWKGSCGPVPHYFHPVGKKDSSQKINNPLEDKGVKDADN